MHGLNKHGFGKFGLHKFGSIFFVLALFAGAALMTRGLRAEYPEYYARALDEIMATTDGGVRLQKVENLKNQARVDTALEQNTRNWVLHVLERYEPAENIIRDPMPGEKKLGVFENAALSVQKGIREKTEAGAVENPEITRLRGELAGLDKNIRDANKSIRETENKVKSLNKLQEIYWQFAATKEKRKNEIEVLNEQIKYNEREIGNLNVLREDYASRRSALEKEAAGRPSLPRVLTGEYVLTPRLVTPVREVLLKHVEVEKSATTTQLQRPASLGLDLAEISGGRGSLRPPSGQLPSRPEQQLSEYELKMQERRARRMFVETQQKKTKKDLDAGMEKAGVWSASGKMLPTRGAPVKGPRAGPRRPQTGSRRLSRQKSG